MSYRRKVAKKKLGRTQRKEKRYRRKEFERWIAEMVKQQKADAPRAGADEMSRPSMVERKT